jgi:hypothetical protein
MCISGVGNSADAASVLSKTVRSQHQNVGQIAFSFKSLANTKKKINFFLASKSRPFIEYIHEKN